MQSWHILVVSGACFGRAENAVRRLGDVLTASWNVLGGSGQVLGRPWGLPGSILEAFLKDILTS